MTRKSSILASGAIVILLGLSAGCWNSAQPHDITAPVNNNGDNQFLPAGYQPLNDVPQHLAHYDQRAFELPGNGEVAYRATMEDIFQDMITLFPYFDGPDPDGGFRQQIYLIQTGRENLIALTYSQSPETIIDQAMRAAYQAMESIYTRQFSDVSDIGKSLDDLGGQLDDLDTTHGDASRTVVAKAVQQMGGIMKQMNSVTDQRAAAAKAAAATTATSPSDMTSSPATAPGMQ